MLPQGSNQDVGRILPPLIGLIAPPRHNPSRDVLDGIR